MSLLVSKEENDFKLGAPSFAQPKAKTYRAIFLSDFGNLSMQLKRKTYPMPKISEMILNLDWVFNNLRH